METIASTRKIEIALGYLSSAATNETESGRKYFARMLNHVIASMSQDELHNFRAIVRRRLNPDL